jgi:hypothetical protein
VHVARLTAAKLIAYYEASRPFAAAETDTPQQKADKQRARVRLQLLYGACDATGAPAFEPADLDKLDLDGEVATPILLTFLEVNGLTEKKSPPPSGPPDGSPPVSA